MKLVFILSVSLVTLSCDQPKKSDSDDRPLICLETGFYSDIPSKQAAKTLADWAYRHERMTPDKESGLGVDYFVGKGLLYKVCPDNPDQFIEQAVASVGVSYVSGLQNLHRNLQDRQLIVVFKKEVSSAQARSVLEKVKSTYHPGMDSSRGKSYFKSTGPKYILHFEGDAKREAFSMAHKSLETVHEIYVPDWTVTKD